MAPLSESLSPNLVGSGSVGEGGRLKLVYHGVVDPDWVGGSAPHGGYLLCILVAACIKSQTDARHRDPVHVTAHYMLPAAVAEYTIEVEVIRTGSRFSNLTANLIQAGETRVMARSIFGTLPAFDAVSSNKKYEDIPPSHPLYHPIPFLCHPSKAIVEVIHSNYFKFKKHVRRADDPGIIIRNRTKLVAPPGTHDGGLESGLWVELTDEDEEIGLGMLPLFADIFRNPPTLVAELEGDQPPARFYPTILITVEFKRQLPRSGTPGFSKRTLGVYTRCSFLDHGRHDVRCEVWTAPSNPGESGGKDSTNDSWKREMRCLAVTGQVAISAPLGGTKRSKL